MKKKQSLGASLAGVSAEDEAKCDAWAAADELRAAVGWRCFQGKASVLAIVTGVPEDAIRRFVDTGEISDEHRRLIEYVK